MGLSTAAIERPPAPAWDVARLFPPQGLWDESDYLGLNRLTNRPIEFHDGRIEVLPMPTKSHQLMVLFLYNLLSAFVERKRLGQVLVAPYPLQLRQGKFREPDLLYARNADRFGEDFATGADLVLEVVSEKRSRDLLMKRREYAKARIAEYWIVDPREEVIEVLRLSGQRYVTHVRSEERVASSLLKGFEVDVKSVFAAGKRGK